MSMNTAADVEPISCFQRDDMSIAARRKRARKAARSTARAHVAILGPTPERGAHGDVVKMAAGHYRAPPPIERMRDRNFFHPTDDFTNEQMFRAAEKLNEYFHSAGLGSGVRAQDLNRLVVGAGDPSHGMPTSEAAAHCRKEMRTALKLMGWWDAYPHRGAGRIVLAVVCFESTLKDAAEIYRPGGSNEARLGAAKDALNEGLFALAVHWRFLRG